MRSATPRTSRRSAEHSPPHAGWRPRFCPRPGLGGGAGPGAGSAPDPGSRRPLKLDFDKDAPFAKYKTYAWLESPARAENLANHIRITRAVEKELSGKGLALDTSGRPDVFVRYIAKIETKVRGSSRKAGSPWEPTDLRTIVDIERVKQGTLIIEMLDGETRDVVWRAVGSDAVARVDLIEDQINTSVATMLAQYPPQPDAASPQP
jgi:hypothetical protein